ncbi:hypothetical protein KCG53_08280 [Neisseria subflava]|uniref:Uncharacterized protein n=1 Tax=Neisseria subflava TaxID=28449 RepID=A0A9X9I4V8_NEISU|nr:hypothetical protein [uncultured Neisseria sp.]UTG75235.1 hypothetical protein KCG53_08280 [Neisseria subflava]
MNLDLSFEVVNQQATTMAKYSDGCSGQRSDCCTRVCTRINNEASSTDAWDMYLEVNAGVLQY